MADHERPIFYRIDALDNITFVNSEWDRFAIANDSPEIIAKNILDRSFWDFVSGITLTQLYRQILRRVRVGEKLRFDFRCDSPDARRFLNMSIAPGAHGGVEFETRTIRIEKRAAQKIFRRGGTRTGNLITACSWCNKIRIGADLWLEAEEAITALGIFGDRAVPLLSHGMCPLCYAGISRALRQ